ncbi:sensor histidine kinase [Thermodesulfobacteriota bacterium]
MKPLSTLFTKILICLIVNLFLVAILLIAFFNFQTRVDLHTILGSWASDRLKIAAELITHDLSKKPSSEWQEILTRHKNINQVDFALVTNDGTIFVSEGLSLPKEVVDRVTSTHNQRKPERFSIIPKNNHHKKRFFDKENRFNEKRLVMNTGNPVMHWMGIPVLVSANDNLRPIPAMLIAGSNSLTGNGFFLDPMPWIIAATSVILISVLMWIPLVLHITKPLRRMTIAAEEIAKGKFGQTVFEKRHDEIGRLSEAINHMTSRLRGFVNGQKQFLRDVAHELGSPIGRIQFGIGILEQHMNKENKKHLEDVAEDVTHLSNLVNELLSFSKADLSPEKVKLEPLKLEPIAKKIAHREGITSDEIVLDIDPDLSVMANQDLLSRALSNLVRNAVTYGGQAGPILIAAKKEGNNVTIEVQDSGPGVLDSLIDKIFEPFFRPEISRVRETGGVGLGLSIVKTCMDACQGTVTARNLHPKGFSVVLNLPHP